VLLDLWFDWENKSSICVIEIFIFFMISWLSNKKDWNCKIYCRIIISNLKKNNYNLCEIEKLREGKDIKRVKNDYECEDEREKNKERKWKIIFIPRSTCVNYLYWVIQVRSSWVVLKFLTLTIY